MLQQSHGIQSNYKLYNVGLHMIKSEVKKIITCQMIVEKLCRGVEPHQAPMKYMDFIVLTQPENIWNMGNFPLPKKSPI